MPSKWNICQCCHCQRVEKRKESSENFACEACRAAKARCEDPEPCKSCIEKGIKCILKKPEPTPADKVQSEILETLRNLQERSTAQPQPGQNLPIGFSKFFEDETLTARKIEWFSTGPDGLYCFMQSNKSFLQSQNEYLLADTKASNFHGTTVQEVDHLSFSTEGGWFLRYTDGTVRLSIMGSFPVNFHNIAGEYMQTRGPAAHIRQKSQLQYVFFGADGAVLVKLTNGTLKWAGLPDKVAKGIGRFSAESWSLTKKSALCQWDKARYYLNWTRSSGAETYSSWNIDLTGILTPALLREIRDGKIPTSHRLPAVIPIRAAPKLTRPSTERVGDYMGFALWPYSSSEKGDLSFEKWEIILNIYRKSDHWYIGRNVKGETGEFPRRLVSLWTAPYPCHVICDNCGESVSGVYYHCSICLKGEFALCRKCEEGPRWKNQCYDSSHVTTLNIHTREDQKSTTCADPYWERSVKDGLLKCFDFHCGQSSEELPDLSSSNISRNAQNNTLSQSGPSSGGKPQNKPEKEENEYEKELSSALDGAIVTESPNVRWDDIAGLDQAKEELHEAVILPIRLPHLFTGKRKARRGMLLYGPPGTGKSYLAKACATEIKCTFFSISCSDIMSKWIGESERLVKTIFKKARKSRPSIIFIDEIDSMSGTRDSGEKYTSGMKTEFLVQMDGVGNDANGVLVLAATNLPWKLDPALRRRFQRRIHIGLPDAQARTRMFQIGVGDMPCELKPEDYEELGRMTEGFSGSDIQIAVQDALMVPVKKISSATHFRKVIRDGVEKIMPCDVTEPGAFPMKWTKVPAEELLEPPLKAEDFFAVLAKSKPSVGQDEMSKYRKWTEDYGSEGA